jgi:hypothetical protein
MRAFDTALVTLLLFCTASQAYPQRNPAKELAPAPSGYTLPGEPGTFAYRRLITVANSGCASGCTDIQVNITLDGSFDYASTLAGGVDVRFTDSDGTTELPYWIESWTAGASASLWVKVPSLPNASSKTIYMYYGNVSGAPPAPRATTQPPIGPFTHSAGYIQPAGGPDNMQPENCINEGGTYYCVVSNYHDLGTSGHVTVGMMHTKHPTNTKGWIWDGTMISVGPEHASSPFLYKEGSTYYIFWWYSRHSNDGVILYSSSSSVTGPYSNPKLALDVGGAGSWDATAVYEPEIVPNYDGKGNCLMLYNGSRTIPSSGDEQVGYATSPACVGQPWTKHGTGPVLPLGPAGSTDAQITADPWTWKIGSTWYVGYTSSPGTSMGGQPWMQSYATTTDWINFTKGGVIFAPGVYGRWDAGDAHRGHMFQVGAQYVMLYSGAVDSITLSYHAGIMTAPVSVAKTILNNCEAVFDFCDDFRSGTLDLHKWSITPGYTPTPNGGILNVRPGAQSVAFASSTAVGKNVVLEAYARWDSASSNASNALEIMLGQGDYNRNSMRVVSYAATNWETYTAHDGYASGFVAVPGAPLDRTKYHKTQIFFDGTQVTYKQDGHALGPLATNITYSALQAVVWLYYVHVPPRMVIHWIRIRKWPGAETTALVAARQ